MIRLKNCNFQVLIFHFLDTFNSQVQAEKCVKISPAGWAIRSQGQTDLCELEANLVYIAGSRPCSTYSVTLSQKEGKKNRFTQVLQEFEASLEKIVRPPCFCFLKKQVEFCEFEASLDFIASTRPSRIIQGDTVSKYNVQIQSTIFTLSSFLVTHLVSGPL